MALAQTLIFMWPSTAASIPLLWSRETALDGKFFSVVTTAAGGTGGSSTHAHTADELGHGHTVYSGNQGIGSAYCDDSSGGTKAAISNTHAHANTGYMNSGETVVTVNATTNLPPYYEVIFIKPSNDSRTGVPNDAWALWDGAAPPDNWTAIDGPKGRFLRGATASGDGGATGGDATHSHTEASHSHTGLMSDMANNASHSHASGSSYMSQSGHWHTVDTTATTETLSTDDGEPAFEKLQVIQNDTGSDDLPYGVIALYLGTVANIPLGWARRTPATDTDFVKCASDSDEIGDTGGSRTHTHTATNHTHTKSAAQTVGSNDTGPGGVTTRHGTASHTHSSWTIVANASIINACSSKAAYPPYVEAMLLKYMAPTTVALDALAVASAAKTATVVPGAVSVALDALAVNAAGKAATIVPGAVAVPMSAAEVRAGAADLSVVPGAITVLLDALAVASVAEGATVAPGAVAVLMDALAVTTAALRATVTSPLNLTIAMNALAVASAAAKVSVVPGPVSVALDALAVGVEAEDLAVIPGAVTVALDAATVAAVAKFLTIAGGAMTLSAGRAITVLAEDRILVIDAERRVIVVAAEPREPEADA